MYKKILLPAGQDPAYVRQVDNDKIAIDPLTDAGYLAWVQAGNTPEEVVEGRAIPAERQEVYGQIAGVMAAMGFAEPPADVPAAVMACGEYVAAGADADEQVARLAQVTTLKTLRDYAVQELGGSWAEGVAWIAENASE